MTNFVESSSNLSQNAICIIPARGGSKRIPRKNIKNFCGKPMISYSIKAAKKSELFSRVVVSSDDLEILEISQSFGAEALLRPKEISDDYANTRDVILHAISALKIPKSAFVCCIYATAPLLSAESLKKAWDLREENCFVFGAAEFSSSPFRGFLIESGIESSEDSIKKAPSPRAKMLFKEHFLKRSQDLAKVYFDAAQFYLASALCWELRENLFEDSIPLILPPSRVCDIDNISDWELAELKFKALKLE